MQINWSLIPNFHHQLCTVQFDPEAGLYHGTSGLSCEMRRNFNDQGHHPPFLCSIFSLFHEANSFLAGAMNCRLKMEYGSRGPDFCKTLSDPLLMSCVDSSTIAMAYGPFCRLDSVRRCSMCPKCARIGEEMHPSYIVVGDWRPCGGEVAIERMKAIF